MPKSTDLQPIIDFHALSARMNLSPEKAKEAGEKLFISLSSREASLSDALIATSRSTKVKPKQLVQLLELLAEDFARPLPDAAVSMGDRISNAASEARAKADEVSDRISKGVASIDVAALREEGAGKVAELRKRAGEVDVEDIATQAKQIGDKAIGSARNFAGKVSHSLASVLPKGTAEDANK